MELSLSITDSLTLLSVVLLVVRVGCVALFVKSCSAAEFSPLLKLSSFSEL